MGFGCCGPMRGSDHLKVTWNSAKERANKRKHRVRFEEAASVFSDPFVAARDDPDHSSYEYRMLALGESSRGRLLVVSYTEYDDEIRIISARRATRRERQDYEFGIYA